MAYHYSRALGAADSVDDRILYAVTNYNATRAALKAEAARLADASAWWGSGKGTAGAQINATLENWDRIISNIARGDLSEAKSLEHDIRRAMGRWQGAGSPTQPVWLGAMSQTVSDLQALPIQTLRQAADSVKGATYFYGMPVVPVLGAVVLGGLGWAGWRYYTRREAGKGSRR